MLGRWKKFLGVFLAFAMVIAMMPGTALRVSAEEETELPVDQVDQFEMELPVVKAGESLLLFAEDYEYDDEDYTVSLTWIDEEGQEVEDETFLAGKTYILQLLYQLQSAHLRYLQSLQVLLLL